MYYTKRHVIVLVFCILLNHFIIGATDSKNDTHFEPADNDGSSDSADYLRQFEADFDDLLKDFHAVMGSPGPENPAGGSHRTRRGTIGRPEAGGLLGLLQRFSPTESINRLHSIMRIPELIRAQGYPSEIHKVLTKDGYILELHRIPGPRLEDQESAERRFSPNESGEFDRFPRFPHLRNQRQSSQKSNRNFHRKHNRRKNRSFHRPPVQNNTNNSSKVNRSSINSDKDNLDLSFKEYTQFGNVTLRASLTSPSTSNESESKLNKRSLDFESTLSTILSFNPFSPIMNFASLFKNSVSQPSPLSRLHHEKPPTRLIKTSNTPIHKPKPAFLKLRSQSVHLSNRRQQGAMTTVVEAFPGDSGASGRPVALIHHGLISASGNFVLNDPHEALAFMLADAGYDVWMANWRGNSYSREHVKMNANQAEFFDFSLDEVIRYDIPAVFDYILNKTQKKDLYYVGHSLGCVMFWGATNFYPELNDKVRVMVALAPAAFMDHAVGLFKKMALFFRNHYKTFERFGIREILVPNSVRTTLFNSLCGPQNPFMKFCYALLPLYIGEVRGSHDPYYTDVILSHFPAGTSSFRILAHFGQFINAGGMQMFDYGKKENLRKYGQLRPPKYSFSTVTVPTAVLWGAADTVTSPKDVQLCARSLPNLILNYRIRNTAFNHVDFMFSEEAATKVYRVALSILSKY